jgi:hypothetical protein
MSAPFVPAGLPSSCEVLDAFDAFCKAFPFASGSRGPVPPRPHRSPLPIDVYWVHWLRTRRPHLDAAAYLKRLEYPL